jgi:hypothetical protein
VPEQSPQLAMPKLKLWNVPSKIVPSQEMEESSIAQMVPLSVCLFHTVGLIIVPQQQAMVEPFIHCQEGQLRLVIPISLSAPPTIQERYISDMQHHMF